MEFTLDGEKLHGRWHLVCCRAMDHVSQTGFALDGRFVDNVDASARPSC